MTERQDIPNPPDPQPRPTPVEIFSYSEVEALVSYHERALEQLRFELDSALRDAERAEQQLRAHPASDVLDDEFEAALVGFVRSRSASELLLTARHVQRAPRGIADDLGRPEAARTNGHDPTEPEDSAMAMAPAAPQAPEALLGSAPVGEEVRAPRTFVVSRPGPSPSMSEPTQSSSARFDRPIEAPKPGTSLLAKLPPRLLIQVGIAVVIIALILLKLG